jgi:MFS family permease
MTERVVQANTTYRRDRVTWAVFTALFSFGLLNSGLGPALPYLREAEHLTYLGGALHQVAFAVGGGLAGIVTARAGRLPGRARVIRVGLLGAGAAWLALGYGNMLAISVAAALVVSLLATAALVRMWAVLADVHGTRRTVAMAEGEVAVSFGGIVCPLIISAVAASMLGWRMSFVVLAGLVGLAVLVSSLVVVPAPAAPIPAPAGPGAADRHVPPTLVITGAIVALEFSLTFWLASYLVDDVNLGRQLAVAMVSGLYVANLVGRILASRLAHRISGERLLAGAIVVALAGLPILLGAPNAIVAGIGLAFVGAGVAAMFPLTSSLHVAASGRTADAAIGQVLAAASIGQIIGPVLVALIAQASNLRVGLITLVGYALLAAAALHRHVVTRP